MTDDKFVKIGHCSRVHGIQGGFSVTLYSDKESILDKGMKVKLIPSSQKSSLNPNGEQHLVRSLSKGNKGILFLTKIADRNQAESIIPFEIYISRDDFPETLNDEFYLSDILGWEVISHGDSAHIGSLESYYDNGAQLILVVHDESGQHIEIIYVKEFVPEIDFNKKQIRVNLPEWIE